MNSPPICDQAQSRPFTGASPPTPPAYPAPKVYDRNDPSSLPDATTDAQMAYIRTAGQPDPTNPVAAIRGTPGAPNSFLASTAPATQNATGGSLTLNGTATPTAPDGSPLAPHVASLLQAPASQSAAAQPPDASATQPAPTGSPVAPQLASLLQPPPAPAPVDLSTPTALTLNNTATPTPGFHEPDFGSPDLPPTQIDPNAGAFAGPADDDDDEQKRQDAARRAAAAARNQPSPSTPPANPAPASTPAGTAPATPFTSSASQALARPGTTTNSTGGPVSDAAITLDRSTDASQALARPGQQTDTGGPVSDAASRLNRSTDASLALNPSAPSTPATPDTGNNFLSSTAPTPSTPSLDDPTSLTLQGTATNNGATTIGGAIADLMKPPPPPPGGFGDPPPFPSASMAQRTTAPNPMAGGGVPHDGSPLADDEEVVNGLRRKKLVPSTSPGAPGPTSASTPGTSGAAGSGGNADS